MSMSFSVQAPVGAMVVGAEDARGVLRPGWARSDPRDQNGSFGTACRDVIDEVRLRMAVRGYQWE